MRTRITAKPWFGPKRYSGWGWTPVSPEGWAATALSVAGIIVSNVMLHGAHLAIAVVVICVLLVGLALITGDPPGGAGSRR